MKKCIILLTGNPGVGKTTVLLRVVEALRAMGYIVGGMISREVRSCGTRVGFEILDIGGSKRGWLAHVDQKNGPQVGRYRVNIEDLNRVGVNAIVRAVESADVIAIDEIGPMELFSEKFRQAVVMVIESGKPVVGVVHWKAGDKIINDVKAGEDTEIHVVNFENRGKLHEVVIAKIVASIGKSPS